MSFENVIAKYKILAAGDYDKALYDAVVEGFKKHGYQALHKEYDKYQGVYFQVSRRGKVLERFWVEDVFEYKDGDVVVYLLPELNTKAKVDKDAPLAVALHRIREDSYEFVDMTNVETWLKAAGEPPKEAAK